MTNRRGFIGGSIAAVCGMLCTVKTANAQCLKTDVPIARYKRIHAQIVEDGYLVTRYWSDGTKTVSHENVTLAQLKAWALERIPNNSE